MSFHWSLPLAISDFATDMPRQPVGLFQVLQRDQRNQEMALGFHSIEIGVNFQNNSRTMMEADKKEIMSK